MNTADVFDRTIERYHLLKHPFYQAWMQGTLTQEELRDYAGQYYHHVEAFPRYLGALHSQCTDATSRRQILDNLNDEEGVNHGVSHPDLWLQFAEGMGASKAEVLASSPRAAVQNVVSTFEDFARSSWHEGLGSLYAYESQIPEIAHSKIEGLVERYGVKDAKTLEFFSIHKTADVYHRQSIRGLLEQLPEEQKQEALLAAEKSAASLWDFLTDVHRPSQHEGACATV